MSSPRLQHVRELVHHWVEAEDVQTMVVLAARRGVIVLHEAAGTMAYDPGSPKTGLDAVFPIASITKVLTATALMTLVDEGRVGLNRPVASYIAEFVGEKKDGVLVRHLLTHTSGLRDEELDAYATKQQGKLVIPPAPASLHPLFHEYLVERYAAPLWKPPGEEMAYAGYNFDLAAEIIRRVSGMSLDRFAYERVFRPLGMSGTFYCAVDVPNERRVIRRFASGAAPGPWSDASLSERLWAGSALASSSAIDMAVLGQMFLNDGAYGDARVLSLASARAMTRNQIPGVRSVFFDQVFPEACWGFGWGIRGNKAGWNGALQSPRTFDHGGNGGVYCWVDPEDEIVGICFSSTPVATTEEEISTARWARNGRNDLLADAVTAAIE